MDGARDAVLAELRWKKFPVLSDGFVCLVDVMGDDAAICQAARVSYGEGTKSTSDDRTLIRYYANIIGNEIVAKLFPLTWEAFQDFRLGAIMLSAREKVAMRLLLSRLNVPVPCTPEQFLTTVAGIKAWQGEGGQPLERCRERDEALAKFVQLGLVSAAAKP